MVSAAVRRAAKNLEVLRSFVWDGEELPPYDDMWFALRISCVGVHVVDALVELKSFFYSCPRLKFISTSLGSILPPPNSHVRATQYSNSIFFTLKIPSRVSYSTSATSTVSP